jgi:hypothetical protein
VRTLKQASRETLTRKLKEKENQNMIGGENLLHKEKCKTPRNIDNMKRKQKVESDNRREEQAREVFT